MQKPIYKLTISILLVFFVHGCTIIPDDDLSKPVDVNLYLGFGQNETSASYVTFDYMVTSIDRIDFYGVRSEGSDIFFDAAPNDPDGIIRLTPGQPSTMLASFDLPQGNYKQMKWEISTKGINQADYSGQFQDNVLLFLPELSGYGIIFAGTYREDDDDIYPLFIVISANDLYSFFPGFESGAASQTIQLPGAYRTEVIFNPYKAVETISQSSWDNAFYLEFDDDNDDDDDGKKSGNLKSDDIDYIIVSTQYNSDLYERILFRLKDNLVSKIEKQ